MQYVNVSFSSGNTIGPPVRPNFHTLPAAASSPFYPPDFTHRKSLPSLPALTKKAKLEANVFAIKQIQSTTASEMAVVRPSRGAEAAQCQACAEGAGLRA